MFGVVATITLMNSRCQHFLRCLPRTFSRATFQHKLRQETARMFAAIVQTYVCSMVLFVLTGIIVFGVPAVLYGIYMLVKIVLLFV